MIKFFCDECEKIEFNAEDLKWYEKNGEEPIFCEDCKKNKKKESEVTK